MKMIWDGSPTGPSIIIVAVLLHLFSLAYHSISINTMRDTMSEEIYSSFSNTKGNTMHHYYLTLLLYNFNSLFSFEPIVERLFESI